MKYYVIFLTIVLFFCLITQISSFCFKQNRESFKGLPTIKYFYSRNSTKCEYDINELIKLKSALNNNSIILIKTIDFQGNYENIKKYDIKTPTIIFENFDDISFEYTGDIKCKDLFNFIQLKYSSLLKS